MRSRRWFALALLVATPAGAQRIRPGEALGFTHTVKLQLDSIARVALRTNKEPIGCVVNSAMVEAMYVLGTIGPAKNVVGADSLGVKSDKRQPVGIERFTKADDFCEWWQPVLHAHVLDNGWLEIPSPPDQRSTAMRGTFGFLLSVFKDSTWKLQSYP
jgi:hypothetical protein